MSVSHDPRHASPDVGDHPPALPTRLLPRMHAILSVRHYSPRTAEAYLGWVRRYVRFHGLRHPRELGAPEVGAFLSHLAQELHVAASTQNQAFAAIAFLYREVLRAPLDPIGTLVHAKRPRRLPVVLTRAEVRLLLAELSGAPALVALLLYGAGLRLLEALTLRVKDVDLERRELCVRDGKGQKDRVTVLPTRAAALLGPHLAAVQRAASARPHRGRRARHAARRARAQAAGGRSVVALAVGLPGSAYLSRRHDGRAAAPPPASDGHAAGSCRRPRGARGSRSARRATRSGTHSRRTCWRTGTTSGRCRSCWGIRTCGRR